MNSSNQTSPAAAGHIPIGRFWNMTNLKLFEVAVSKGPIILLDKETKPKRKPLPGSTLAQDDAAGHIGGPMASISFLFDARGKAGHVLLERLLKGQAREILALWESKYGRADLIKLCREHGLAIPDQSQLEISA